MKKYYIIYLLLIFSLISKSQDTIVKVSGDKIAAKIININGFRIEYKRSTYLNGPTISINKVKVWKVIFYNGDEEIYNNPSCYSDIVVVNSTDSIKKYSRKGISLGMCYGTGYGQIVEKKYSSNVPDNEIEHNLSYLYGFLIKGYFNNVWGIKTGLLINTYSFDIKEYNLINYQPSEYDLWKYDIEEIIFPIEITSTIGSRVSFEFAFGVLLAHPIKGTKSCTDLYYIKRYDYGEIDFTRSLPFLVLNEKLSMGVNIPIKRNISINLNLFQTLSLTNYHEFTEMNAYKYGITLGIDFRFR